MFTVIQRKKLADKAATIEVFTPRIASVMLPGQFVSLKTTAQSPWIAMPVSAWNVEAGTITLFVDVVDEPSRRLASDIEISMLYDLDGPHGTPSEIASYSDKELFHSNILYVAEGAGTAVAHAQIKWLAGIGCSADVIVSACTKEELLFTKELEKLGNNIHYATLDGSLGFQGTEAQLLEILLHKELNSYDLIVTIGSLTSMKAISLTAQDFGIPLIANFTQQLFESANAYKDFKVNMGRDMKTVATDGPEFHAFSLDFEQALSSLRMSLRASEDYAPEAEVESKIINLNERSNRWFTKKQAYKPVRI